MGLFNRNRKPLAPYDTLEPEKRYALYFLLEYLTMNGVPFHEQSWAFQYLEKAAKYFGLTNNQIQDFRPFYSTYEKIIEHIKDIKNRQILEFMISNCSNLFILMDGGIKHKELGEQAYKLYEELGFSYEEVRTIVRKYQYRTEI
ncbi:MAG: hypothetical protein HDS45_05035 [Bacteroides sp.]|nr:hypothetical protein [Bacteroides sp.]MBD5268944.1 hypothetical protein [Bacteroides sp.]